MNAPLPSPSGIFGDFLYISLESLLNQALSLTSVFYNIAFCLVPFFLVSLFLPHSYCLWNIPKQTTYTSTQGLLWEGHKPTHWRNKVSVLAGRGSGWQVHWTGIDLPTWRINELIAATKPASLDHLHAPVFICIPPSPECPSGMSGVSSKSHCKKIKFHFLTFS